MVPLRPLADCGRQYFLHHAKHALPLFCTQPIATSRGSNAGLEKYFIRVDVSESGEESLVHEHCFHGASPVPENRVELVEIDIQGIRAQSPLADECPNVLYEEHSSQFPDGRVRKGVAVLELHHHPRVRGRLVPLLQTL